MSAKNAEAGREEAGTDFNSGTPPDVTPRSGPCSSEIAARADFSIVRYAQCWEDADVLLAGLDIQPGDNCIAVASAGDNALAMLTRDPALVVALDLNPAQLHCLELRVAAYRELDHAGLLALMGSHRSNERKALYQRCRKALSPDAVLFWDARISELELYGLGGLGKFERYFRIFKRFILPLCHGQDRVAGLFTPRNQRGRMEFFETRWCNLRWKLLSALFFSRPVLGRLGRDPAFFTHAKDSFGAHIKHRIRHALAVLPPEENPYLHWILRGEHAQALPTALRPENFDLIRRNLPRLRWELSSLEDYTDRAKTDGLSFKRFNLSNIFEYMSEKAYKLALDSLLNIADNGARLLYWNMLVPRFSPESMRSRLTSLSEQAAQLYDKDKAFFYSRLVLEQVI